jgi:hypothetical protein
MHHATHIEGLIGEELSAIYFARDYVELSFDGPVVRSLTTPTVHVDGYRHQFPDAGSRDALCEIIGR